MLMIQRREGEAIEIYDQATREHLGSIVVTQVKGTSARVALNGDRLLYIRRELLDDPKLSKRGGK